MNEVLKAIQMRRSCRSYRPEQIAEETLQQILEAGVWAASGQGAQSAVMVAVQDRETREQLQRMNAEILGVRSDPFYGAPAVVVVLADPERPTCVEDGSSFAVSSSASNIKSSIGTPFRPYLQLQLICKYNIAHNLEKSTETCTRSVRTPRAVQTALTGSAVIP